MKAGHESDRPSLLMGEGETLACAYHEFAGHVGFFLALAGISTVRQIRGNAFDISKPPNASSPTPWSR
jgi:hypothetical protein